MTASTVPQALADALRGDAAAPFVTWVGAQGLRTELSLRTFENNLAKAANLMRDDADMGPGDVAALHLPLHWQVAVWLGACGMVGSTAAVGADPHGAQLSIVSPGSLGLPLAPLTLATSLHPFGLPVTEPLPPGVLDAATEVRMHGDRFVAYPDVVPSTTWLSAAGREWTQADALEDARALGAELGLAPGGRLLVAGTAVDATTVLCLVALPLALQGSVVLLTDPAADADAVAAAERCQVVLRAG